MQTKMTHLGLRRKFLLSIVLGGLGGYLFTIFLFGVIAPFTFPSMGSLKGKLIFLAMMVLGAAVFAYLILGKWEAFYKEYSTPSATRQKSEWLDLLKSNPLNYLRLGVLIVLSIGLVLGISYQAFGWLLPPDMHRIEFKYVSGHTKLRQIELASGQTVELSALRLEPENGWDVTAGTITPRALYANFYFTIADTESVRFDFSANSSGLVYLTIDGRTRSFAVTETDPVLLLPLQYLGLPARFSRWIVVSGWAIAFLLISGILLPVLFLESCKAFLIKVVFPYCLRVVGILLMLMLLVPFASHSTYVFFNAANICMTNELCHFLLLPDTAQPWWFAVGVVAVLLIWELADRYRQIGTPVVLALGGALAVVVLSMNFAQDLDRLPLSFDECLSNSADGCLFQHRPGHGLDEMYGRRTAIQAAGYLNEYYPGSKLIVPENLYAETFYWVDLQPGPAFEGEIETVLTALVLTAEEEAYLVDFAHTFYPRLQETDATDRPIYLIHPDNYAPAVPVFVARMADDGSVFVYPEGLLP